MIAVAAAIAPIFLLIVAGYGFKRSGFPGEAFWSPAERLSYFVLLPALIVHTLWRADLAGIQIGALAATVISLALAMSVLALLARPLFRADGPAFTSILQGTIRLNAYLGFALAFAFYGDRGLAIGAVFVAMMMPTINAICVAALVAFGAGGRPSWTGVAVGIATNPLILACALGAALSGSGLPPPGWAASVLGILAPAALPIALLCVGAGLNFSSVRARSGTILATSALKLVVAPALAWGIAAATGLIGPAFAVAMLFAATPASPSTYVLARQLGGDAGLMAGIVTVETALSVLTMSAILIWLGGLAMP